MEIAAQPVNMRDMPNMERIKVLAKVEFFKIAAVVAIPG